MIRHEEDRLQIACVRWFSLQYPRLAPLLHHSPNGGQRNKLEAVRFKQMGVRAGFPDLILALPRCGYGCLFIELKSATGRQSPRQKQWQEVATRHGQCYRVVRSVEGFIELITNYLNNKEI